MVPPDSHRISGVRCYSGSRTRAMSLRLRGSHPLCHDFPAVSTSLMVYDSSSVRQNRPYGPTTPQVQRPPAITYLRFSLFQFRSPLLPESLLFSLPAGTEMFHFPAFPPTTLCVQVEVTGLSSSRVSPFGHPRITARLSAPQGLSQTPTSFIGSRCQGIHHVHLVACCFYKDARVHCEVLKIRPVPPPDPTPTHHTVADGSHGEDDPKKPSPKTRSLRTQQCADPPDSPRPRSTPPKEAVLETQARTSRS